MNNSQKVFFQSMIDLLKKFAEDKRKEGLVPTIDLLVEELEEQLKTQNGK